MYISWTGNLYAIVWECSICINSVSVVRLFIYRLKTTWTLVHKWLQIGSEFSPTLRKFWISLHCQASQTEQTELNHTLPNGEWQFALTICRREVGVIPPKKLGTKKLLHLFGFPTTSRLNGECLLNDTWHRQLGKSVGKHEIGLPIERYQHFGRWSRFRKIWP